MTMVHVLKRWHPCKKLKTAAKISFQIFSDFVI